ncbi:MAG: type II toxin-antitoxin system Phd/YefM family antitoxin [Spirochaetales bacterium]|nr:type II toxin-antitoxin system Phd/YefM family antitoxin [Spirochaetales bacterium]
MKTVPVAEVRSNLSSLLKEVESGSEIGISFGRQRNMIAVIVPIAEYKRIKERKLGSLAGRLKVEFRDDWRMTDDEFLNS